MGRIIKGRWRLNLQGEKSQRFKVIGDNGIEIWFSTRKYCEQYIKSRNDEKSCNNKYGVEYSIIEYNQKKKTKREKNE